MLLCQDDHAENFIAGYSEWKKDSTGAALQAKSAEKAVFTKIRMRLSSSETRSMLAALRTGSSLRGKLPFDLVNESLIPAITEVGSRYEKKIYFLPQLIRSAETMQAGFAHLKPLMKQDASVKRPVIIMATVQGDVHDIGKNIVCLLLGNHGFDVVDAGKDVPAEKIVEMAIEHHARLIGLSALMTTTMVRMEDTIQLVKEKNLPIKVMVGGAAVTKAFADSIGADAYCVDAVAAGPGGQASHCRSFSLPLETGRCRSGRGHSAGCRPPWGPAPFSYLPGPPSGTCTWNENFFLRYRVQGGLIYFFRYSCGLFLRQHAG